MIDLVLERQQEVTSLMRSVPGFVSYVIAKAGDDAWFTGTICQDKAGCDQTVKIAAEWISKNAAHTGVAAPQITEGTILLRIMA